MEKKMLMTRDFLQLTPSSSERIRQCFRTYSRICLPVTLNFLSSSGVDFDLVDELRSNLRSPSQERKMAALVLLEIYGSSAFSCREALNAWLARRAAKEDEALRAAAKMFAKKLRQREAIGAVGSELVSAAVH